jgi:mannose-6-phosphate isomerase class I
LHVDAALEAIDYSYGPADPQTPQPTDPPYVERLVACAKFVVDRWKLDVPREIGGDERCHLLAVIAGQVVVACDPDAKPLHRGATVLLPACLGTTELTPTAESVLLDVYLP